MFNHLLRYRLKQLIKNKSIIFWSLVFPIVLASFFKMAFNNLDAGFEFKVIPVAVVETVTNEENGQFISTINQAKNNKKEIFKVQSLTEKEAKKALNENKISGYYLLSQSKPALIINQNGFNQTFLKDFLKKYTYISSSMSDIAKEKPELLSEDLMKELMENHNYQTAEKYSENEPKSTALYFFTVIAMACMFGMNWGVKNSQEIQANQSPTGIRMTLNPTSKVKVIIANLIAAFVIFFSEIMIILAFIHLVLKVDFGQRWNYILLTCFLACLLSISLGTLVGAGIKGNQNLKSTIVTTVSVFGGFLSGMMFPDVKYWIDTNTPIIGWLNPTSLVTDALYKLFYYSDLTSYFKTILMMLVMTILFNIVSYFIMRRQNYVSI